MLTVNRHHRWLASLAIAFALTALGIATTATEASAAPYWTTTNTGQSSTGAFLQSHGVCGYGGFNFTIDSRGFEYIQIGTETSLGTIWEYAVPVEQIAMTRVQVGAFQSFKYHVVGWDWTSNGWETVWVLTDFWYPHTGDYLHGC